MLPLDGAPRRHLPIGLRTNHGCMHRCWDDHSHARYRVRHSPLALAIVRRRWPNRLPNRSGGVTSCGMGLGGGWAFRVGRGGVASPSVVGAHLDARVCFSNFNLSTFVLVWQNPIFPMIT